MSAYITWIKYGLFLIIGGVIFYKVFLLTKQFKEKFQGRWKKDKEEELDFDLNL